jgi:pimeloyl-ACP methyl ester carboxylesterase
MNSMPTAPRFLERPEGRLAYDDTGDGPLVVCLPGMGDLRQSYRALVPALVADGHRVVTLDLRGHGDSSTGFTRFDAVAHGWDLVALVDELDAGPAVLIGSSLGAGAAAWAAAERPELVRALVLSGPFVRDVPIGRAARLGMRLALRRPWGVRAWSAFYASLFPGRPPADLAGHRARIEASLRRPDQWRAFIAITHSSHAPVEARLGQVTAPTLVVMGERDRDFPDPAAEAALVADRTGGELLLVPDAGHYPHAEYPERVLPAVRRLLEQAPCGA